MSLLHVDAQDPVMFRVTRESMNLSQIDLGILLDMNSSAISRYEKNRRPIPIELALAMEALVARGVYNRNRTRRLTRKRGYPRKVAVVDAE